MKLPTDRYILECIFQMYERDYPGPTSISGRGENNPYVPVDLYAVAKEVGCSPELLFGRLYFHLNQKHRYKQENRTDISLFELNVENKGHSVQFPYLASILAGLNQEFRRQLITYGVSFTALGISIASLAVSILKL